MDKLAVKEEKLYKRQMMRYGVVFGIISVITFAMFVIVQLELAMGTALMATLLLLAGIQVVLQLRYFLHLGNERPRFTLWGMVYGGTMALVVVLGSLWIMINMNYNMHYSPEQMKEFMLKQNQKGF